MSPAVRSSLVDLGADRRLGFTDEGRRREGACHADPWHDEVPMSLLDREQTAQTS